MDAFSHLPVLICGNGRSSRRRAERYLPEPANLAFHLVLGRLAVIAAVWAGERFHKANAIVTAVMLTVYIVALFARLR